MCKKSANGSSRVAVAGQCDVSLNKDQSFSEAAELSRAPAAAGQGVFNVQHRNKTQPRRYEA